MCNACGIRYRRKFFSNDRPNPIYFLQGTVQETPLIIAENLKEDNISLPVGRPKKMQIQYLLDD